MRWLEWLMGWQAWMTYLRACYYTMLTPTAKHSGTICQRPQKCRRNHRFALVPTKGHRARILLIHTE